MTAIKEDNLITHRDILRIFFYVRTHEPSENYENPTYVESNWRPSNLYLENKMLLVEEISSYGIMFSDTWRWEEEIKEAIFKKNYTLQLFSMDTGKVVILIRVSDKEIFNVTLRGLF